MCAAGWDRRRGQVWHGVSQDSKVVGHRDECCSSPRCTASPECGEAVEARATLSPRGNPPKLAGRSNLRAQFAPASAVAFHTSTSG